MDLSHLGLLFAVFSFTLMALQALPEILQLWRERYSIHTRRTSRELSRFFIDIKPSQILAISMVVGLVLGFLSKSYVFGISLAVGGVFAPKLILTIWKGIRSAKVEAQLMDALMVMNNSLKSGLDISAAIERVATSMPAPICEEFGLVLNAYKLGAPLESALMDMTYRISSRTLETVIYAINIQRETGGNLIKTFDQLMHTIRDESKLQKKVSALTSQARTQIVFLAIFPWVLAVLFFMAPDFMRPALQSSWGQITLVGLILWEGIGIMVTKKIVEVRA